MPGLKATPVQSKKTGLNCPHCHLLLRDPVQTEEGLRFCKSCFNELQSMPGPCSDCGININKSESAFPDRAVLRELKVLPVYCLYRSLGCKWEGPLSSWEDHCGNCSFKGVECPNEGCKEIVAERQLEEHKKLCQFRIENCEYCSEPVRLNLMTTHHNESCQEIIVRCDNEDCKEELPRRKIAEHKLKFCHIEECLTCRTKVYRKTGVELTNQPSDITVDFITLPTTGEDSSTKKTKSRVMPDGDDDDDVDSQIITPTSSPHNERNPTSEGMPKQKTNGHIECDGDEDPDAEYDGDVSEYDGNDIGGDLIGQTSSNTSLVDTRSDTERALRQTPDGGGSDGSDSEENGKNGSNLKADGPDSSLSVEDSSSLDVQSSPPDTVPTDSKASVAVPTDSKASVAEPTDSKASAAELTDSKATPAKPAGKAASHHSGGHVHLSVPKENFRHHQEVAVKVRDLQNVVRNLTAHDISESHVIIKDLRREIAVLKQNHEKEIAELRRNQAKQYDHYFKLETELAEVKEQLESISKRPPVDKNLQSKVQELEKRIPDRGVTRGEIEELKRKIERVGQSLEHNVKAVQDMQLKSHNFPSDSRRPTGGYSGGDGAHYGGGASGSINESRFFQLERRVEDLAREANTTRCHVQELEIQLQAQVAATYNGSCLWRIPDVAKRKRDALEDRILSIYSPAFYTGRHGYKMCCRMYLNGDGMGLGTHISVFFVVMRGDYDALLKWPFEHKVSLILVDQTHRKHVVQTFKPTPDSSSFRRPQTDMNVASGCPQFAKLDVLDDERYVKDDTMFIKCIVDTSKIFHP